MTMDNIEKLYEAVKAHCGMDDDHIIEAGEHGADAGFPGFTYTKDCCEFFDANAEAIWELAVEETESMGNKNVAEMISTFGRSDMLDSWDGFRNLMAWYALEQVARWLADKRLAATKGGV